MKLFYVNQNIPQESYVTSLHYIIVYLETVAVDCSLIKFVCHHILPKVSHYCVLSFILCTKWSAVCIHKIKTYML